jgi:hypothetical protein
MPAHATGEASVEAERPDRELELDRQKTIP